MPTLKTPVLTDQQIGDFRRDRYVVVRATFGATEMARIDTWARELAAMPEEAGRHWVYWEQSLLEPDRKIINRIENISPCHSGFAELSQTLKAPVGQLLGEEAVLFKEKINFKMPGGDGFKPQQDSQDGWDAYATLFITVTVCIDEATGENGCLNVAAGEHQRGLLRGWEPLTEDDMAGMDFTICPTWPGDLVFLDSNTPHGSAPNMSDTVRRLYFATYNRLSEGDHLARYYADKRQSYPPDIEREPGKEYVFRV